MTKNETIVRVVRNAGEARKIAGELLTLRAPHYTVSAAGALDELFLARDGVLYLDEACSWKRETIDALCDAIRSAAKRGDELPRAILIELTGGPNPLAREREIEARLRRGSAANRKIRVAIAAALTEVA